jgi:AsmA protein
MEPLRQLDVAGQLRVGRLKVNNLRLSDLQLKVDGREGRFRIHPLSARLYGGRYQGDIRLDARGDRPRVNVDEHLAGVGTGPLLKDLMGRAYVTGTADVRADLGFQGSEADAMLNSLTGQGSYVLRDGAVHNLDLERALTAAYAALGKEVPRAGEGDKTPFRELKGSATVEEGRVRSEDLALRSDLMDVSGGGILDLPEARMDYRLEAVIGEGVGGGLAELKGLAVPVQVVGPVMDPAVKVDLAGLLKERARKALEGDKEKAGEKAQDTLEEKKKELEEKARDILGF